MKKTIASLSALALVLSATSTAWATIEYPLSVLGKEITPG